MITLSVKSEMKTTMRNLFLKYFVRIFTTLNLLHTKNFNQKARLTFLFQGHKLMKDEEGVCLRRLKKIKK